MMLYKPKYTFLEVRSIYDCQLTTSYRQTYNISRKLLGNILANHSDIAGASPVDAAPTSFSFST